MAVAMTWSPKTPPSVAKALCLPVQVREVAKAPDQKPVLMHLIVRSTLPLVHARNGQHAAGVNPKSPAKSRAC